MPIRKISIPTRRLAPSLAAALPVAARLGVEGIEIDLRSELPARDVSQTAARHLRKLMDDCRLSFGSAVFPTRSGLAEAEGIERRLDALRQAMHAASRLGCRVLVVRPGRVPPQDDAAGSSRLMQVLSELGNLGQREGVTPTLESGPNSPAEIAGLIDALPPGLLGANLHPGQLLQAGHNPIETVGMLGARITHVYAADAVHDPDARRVVDVELGRGAAELPDLLGALEGIDYRGWVTIDQAGASLEGLECAVDFLRAL